jgi:hypothetical protein
LIFDPEDGGSTFLRTAFRLLRAKQRYTPEKYSDPFYYVAAYESYRLWQSFQNKLYSEELLSVVYMKFEIPSASF